MQCKLGKVADLMNGRASVQRYLDKLLVYLLFELLLFVNSSSLVQLNIL